MKLETIFSERFKTITIKFRVPLTETVFLANLHFYSTPKTWVYGYSSRTQQGKYVLFHDYDNLTKKDVVDELKYLQEKFKLSDYYLFSSPDKKDSFHAVCLDSFCLKEAYEIQKQTSSDTAFIQAPLKLASKEWILRIGKKGNRPAPRFIEQIVSNNEYHAKSTAHANFLRAMGIIIPKTGKWDNCKELGIIKYNTSNRVKL